MIAPTWNDEFEFPDSSYSVLDIQNYIEYIITKHEILLSLSRSLEVVDVVLVKSNVIVNQYQQNSEVL